ncbi:dihydropteroate synthase [candidate division KSB1 bacterium]|nr:dihydropteroate synthase [candidate division KSB1 bacterium]
MTDYKLDCRGVILDLSKRTQVMGILNITPDSFSDGGKFTNPDIAIEHAIQMEQEGADIIDVGAESTRPGSDAVSLEDELNRLQPVVSELLKKLTIPISVDTYKAPVAEEMLKMGVHLINDISGLRFDAEMKNVVAKYQSPVVVMHIKGTPKNMQKNPHYKNVIREVYAYLGDSVNLATRAGIKKELIVIDPGLGFGKRLQDNYEIIRSLRIFESIGCPILLGPSRKSFIGKILELDVDQRLEGTAAAVAIAICNGTHIVRVHDVKEMKRVCHIADLISGKASIETLQSNQ